MEEHRKFVRINWPIVVQYKTLQEPFTQDQIKGTDISEGGVRFVVYERLPKGSELDMQIQIPFDSMPIFAKGAIVWIKNIGEDHARAFEVGVSFTDVEPRDKKRLKMYIDNEMKERES
jgi:c-di-GMP-binding flagellar brake protein YcgR